MKTFKLRFVSLLFVCTFGFITVFAQDGFVKYKISKGETLYSIAEKYGVTVEDIKKANPKAGNIFYAGMTIQIPIKKDEIKPNATAEKKFVNAFFAKKTEKDVSVPNDSQSASLDNMSIGNSEEHFQKWTVVGELGYGFIDDAFAYKATMGFTYSLTKSFYVGAQIGYNSFNYNKYLRGYGTVESNAHFITLPLEVGYKLMTDNGKWGIIPFAGVGFNIGLKGKTIMNEHLDNRHGEDIKIGGKLGMEGRLGVRASIYIFNITGSYHLPLNSKQESFFGEDAYPELSIGWGF